MGGILADHQIRLRAERDRMIVPFAPTLVRKEVVSFGPSSYGYDLRLASECKRILPPTDIEVMDPKVQTPLELESMDPDRLVVQPGETVLGRSLEYFRIPRDILALVWGKSTYARCGLLVNVTPLEPEWEGYITMALANIGRLPVRLYPGEGIAQVVFIQADSLCRTSYADRKGKYQAQTKVTPPSV